MNIRINKRENPFAQIGRALLQDERLSFRARGIAAYLFSKPDNWQCRITDLRKNGIEGRDAIRTAMKELEQAGYAELKTLFDQNGHLAGKEWQINEEPVTSRQPENPTVGKSENRETRPYNNNGESNTDIDIVEQSSTAHIPEIIVYLNEVTGRQFKDSSAATKRLVSARLKEGYSIEDFKKVIDTKARQWKGDSKMKAYLRPITLFGTKFESYLQEAGEREKEIAAHSAGETDEWDENYKTYLDWVQDNYPAIMGEIRYLSKSQFVAYKTKTFAKDLHRLTEGAQWAYFEKSHERLNNEPALQQKWENVWNYYCWRIDDSIKFATQI